MKISRLHIVRISTLRWTEFHQNRKDPIREIQRFPNLGHNLCENDKQTLHGLYLINYEIHLCILGILVTDGSLQVSKTLSVDYQCKVSSRIYPYFVNGIPQTYSCVRCENSVQMVSAPSFQIIFLKTIQAIIWKPIYIQTSVRSKPLL